MKNTIIIATIKTWNIENFYKLQRIYKKYNLILFTSPEELTIQNISKYNPSYIFFPHWSWKINEDIFLNYKCIIFHETDLPFGRGGSPLQNLIIRKIYTTKISAIQCTKEIDEGDIYIQETIDISKGDIESIFRKISKIIFFNIIPKLIKNDYIPSRQIGEVTTFKRRTPEDSNLLNYKCMSINCLYDFIRMVDSKEYPKAFIKIHNFKIEFSKVDLKKNKLIGRFEVLIDE